MSFGKHTNTSDTRAIEYHKITADPEENKTLERCLMENTWTHQIHVRLNTVK